MSELLFCGAALVLLIWVVLLKKSIALLREEIEWLENMLKKHIGKAKELVRTRERSTSQAVMWRGRGA